MSDKVRPMDNSNPNANYNEKTHPDADKDVC